MAKAVITFLALSSACAASHSPSKTTPVKIPAGSVYPDTIKHPLPEDLSGFKQPASLLNDLKTITTGTLEERLNALVVKSKRDQVFVKGGTFLMGDFGPVYEEDRLHYVGLDASPLHKVTLDSYSISKYKVTYTEFDLYTEANGLPKIQQNLPSGFATMRNRIDTPAGVTWEQAKAYCQWLGTISKLPFDLPTEAQWEYAARNRGKFVLFGTNNGLLELNKNSPSDRFAARINDDNAPHAFPIALFPPSPLGIYDLTPNSFDWVEDWYAIDYYEQYSGERNPVGPTTGIFKVERGGDFGRSFEGRVTSREFNPPDESKIELPQPDGRIFQGGRTSDGFRCGAQSTKRVQ